MRGRRGATLFITLLLAVAGAALVPSSALAQVRPRVTLNAARGRLTFGESVRLWGRISAPEGQRRRGQLVRIVDVRRDVVIARDRTNRRGVYNVSISPRRRVKMRARWVLAGGTGPESDTVTVRVRPRVRASMRRVRLFDRGVIRGSVRPAHPGERVTVRLKRHGRVVWSRRVRLRGDGIGFRTRFTAWKPGTYRARAIFNDADHLPGADASARRSTPLPSLSIGSRSRFVKLLERRLRRLNYHLTGVNRRYDRRTRDAVIAFNKVQGRARSGAVGAGTWRALADPLRPRPRFRRARYHFEINQTKQVIYVVRRGRVRAILHTSTGANGATRDGTFRVHRKLAGYSRNRLYYPSYFDGLRAFHGWPSVPTYPASHGCARAPMWAAKWLFRIAPMGVQVRVYH